MAEEEAPRNSIEMRTSARRTPPRRGRSVFRVDNDPLITLSSRNVLESDFRTNLSIIVSPPHAILMRGSMYISTISARKFARTTATPPITTMNCRTGKSRSNIALIVRQPSPG